MSVFKSLVLSPSRAGLQPGPPSPPWIDGMKPPYSEYSSQPVRVGSAEPRHALSGASPHVACTGAVPRSAPAHAPASSSAILRYLTGMEIRGNALAGSTPACLRVPAVVTPPRRAT